MESEYQPHGRPVSGNDRKWNFLPLPALWRPAASIPYGIQVTSTPFVRLNVEGVQNAAALRYHTW